MNTQLMHAQLDQILAQYRDPSAYSDIPQHVQHMGAALRAIENYTVRLHQWEKTLSAANNAIADLEGRYYFLTLRSPLRSGGRRDYLHDMPRPYSMLDSDYLRIRNAYSRNLFLRTHASNHVIKLQRWINAEVARWNANIQIEESAA